MMTGPQALQQAEWELWRFTSHCGDLSTSDAQLHRELEALLQLRTQMMGMAGMDGSWSEWAGLGAAPEQLVHRIATTLAEHGNHMSLADLVESPDLADAKKGVSNMPMFLAKYPDLFTVLDDANSEAPGAATVTLIGEVPAVPEQGGNSEAYHAALSDGAGEPPTKKPRFEANACYSGMSKASSSAFDHERASRAVAEMADRVKELLLGADGGRMRLEEVALDETVKELRRDLSKSKKLGQLLREQSGLFELTQGPRSEGVMQECTWVSLAFGGKESWS